MIAADTNVLLRFVVRDDAPQFAKAHTLIAKQSRLGEPVFITRVVAVEMVWALSSTYRYSREDIGNAIEFFLDSNDFLFEREDLILEALELFRSTKIDFADALIALVARDAGCSAIYTFDKDFAAAGIAEEP